VKKYILAFLITQVFIGFAVAQNLQLIDSIKNQLTGAQGEKKFELLNDLAWEYRWAYPDSTIHYAKQANILGQGLKLPKSMAQPVNFMGVALNYKGNRLSAVEHFEEALKISTTQHDSIQIAHSNNNLGRLYFEQGLLSRAYTHFIKALSIFEDLNDSTGLAYTYQSLANLYKSQRDYKKAEHNYLKANSIRLALKNTRDIMSGLVQTARLYEETNQTEKALKFLHLADSAGTVIQDEINLAEIKTFIAENYLHKDSLDAAEAICTEGLRVIQSKNIIRMLPHAYLTLGQIKVQKNDLREARKYFTEALRIASSTKDLAPKMRAHYFLWKLSGQERNKSGELENLNQYLILKDSIKDLDLARQVERLQFEIEIERKEKENELLKVNQAKTAITVQQQKLQNIILIIIVGFVSVLGLIQWRSSKKRREVNVTLAHQNEFIQNQRREIIEQNEKLSRHNQQLSDLNHEKDTLMSIVAHDLKSPLNAIKGVADLMEIEGGLTTDQKKYVSMTKEATQSGLYLIKDLLDVHMLEENVIPNYSTFDISDFLLRKVNAYQPAADSKGIHLHITRIENEEVYLDADYLGRIVDNLLTNAIKFSSKNTTIDVAAGKSGNEIWISIKDKGQGFSDRDKRDLFQKFKKLSSQPTAGESSNGLGLAIVKTLVDRLKGTIELISEKGKGSEFIIRLPASKKPY
jgi:signal transduction histidine kinase/Tfp pilus assembly protein PilF